MTKKIRWSIFGILATTMIGTSAFAGTNFTSYNTTVRKFAGSGYTGYQVKAETGKNGALSSTSVGGDYVVSARMVNALGVTGAWTNSIGDNQSVTLYSSERHVKAQQIRVEFSNKLTTPVDVQVTGTWKSN